MNTTLGSSSLGSGAVDRIIRPRTLAQQMEQDLEKAFMDTVTGHAVTASFQPAGQIAYYVDGILNSTPNDVQAMADFAVAPWTFTCRQSTVKVARKGDTIVVNETQYIITGVDHDGTGMTTLALSLDSHG